MLKVGLLSAALSFSMIVSLNWAGYWVMTLVLPLIGCSRVSRNRCSRSSTSASFTLPLSIWLTATDVGTWV